MPIRFPGEPGIAVVLSQLSKTGQLNGFPAIAGDVTLATAHVAYFVGAGDLGPRSDHTTVPSGAEIGENGTLHSRLRQWTRVLAKSMARRGDY
jgi:hypothetical protein